MESSGKHFLKRKHLHGPGWVPTVLLALCIFAPLAGCLPQRSLQKLPKPAAIKSAPRTAALVKQMSPAPADWQIYLPYMSQMQPANPPTHPSSPPPVAPTSSPPGLNLLGIDFGKQQEWVRIKIYPKTRRINNGQPILLKFLPGEHCTFGDQHACVAAFRGPGGIPVIWLTIHSGVGGEGQPLRNAIEGTGINQAAYSLQEISANLQALSGSQVVISQGTTTVRDLRLQAMARIPGSMLQGYFNTPLENTLDFSAQVAPELQPINQSTQSMIIFETCGWRVAGQPGFPDTTDTSASVYLGLIQSSP
jgi:hypothetical protein